MAKTSEVFDLIGVDAEHLGWIPPDKRDRDCQEAHEQIVGQTPNLLIVGAGPGDDVKEAHLTRFLRQANGGAHVLPYYQEIGSCVGQGAGRVVDTLAAVEIFRDGDNEEFRPCFLPYHYGRGRLHAGIRGSGSGSTGSGQAKAIRTDGVLFNFHAGLPKTIQRAGGITWTGAVETAWSDGARIDPKWIEKARPHVVRSTALCRTHRDVRDAIRNGYPVTCASDWGGMMRPPVKDGRLLNRRADRWMHQMCFLDWESHPTLGDIFWCQNSWGDAHGKCPSGQPLGGFWLQPGDVDYICAQGETFAFSQFDGFPAQPSLFLLL